VFGYSLLKVLQQTNQLRKKSQSFITSHHFLQDWEELEAILGGEK
jgi:hypothetical protein